MLMNLPLLEEWAPKVEEAVDSVVWVYSEVERYDMSKNLLEGRVEVLFVGLLHFAEGKRKLVQKLKQLQADVSVRIQFVVNETIGSFPLHAYVKTKEWDKQVEEMVSAVQKCTEASHLKLGYTEATNEHLKITVRGDLSAESEQHYAAFKGDVLEILQNMQVEILIIHEEVIPAAR